MFTILADPVVLNPFMIKPIDANPLYPGLRIRMGYGRIWIRFMKRKKSRIRIRSCSWIPVRDRSKEIQVGSGFGILGRIRIFLERWIRIWIFWFVPHTNFSMIRVWVSVRYLDPGSFFRAGLFHQFSSINIWGEGEGRIK